MLHVLYIILVFLSYEENQKSGVVMQPLTGPYVYGVNRRFRECSSFVRFTFCVRKVYQKQI